MLKRYGGTITMDCDPLLKTPRSFLKNHLFFSHGRSAMIWLLHNYGPFSSAAVCAYTWPEIPTMMERYNLKIGLFDFGQKEILNVIKSLPRPRLIIVPVFYGFKPWIDYLTLNNEIENNDFILVDAAQTAFGFENYELPNSGAVMSCPHKATALNDGSVLALDDISNEKLLLQKKLESAEAFSSIRKASRLLLNTNDPYKEKIGISLVEKLEEKWPSDPPQKITNKSLIELSLLDKIEHERIRRENYKVLNGLLKDHFTPAVSEKSGVPFAYPLLTNNRDVIIEKLKQKRVFATPLWPNARLNKLEHPKAALFSNQLMALPIDQRYNIDDMENLAKIVLSIIK
tara:strand:+ start:4343 stop:5371 length:1029 start_codon:yes stop_codon:yes gene_type:complete